MATIDLGLVTAYAYAVSKGYTGTEAQFAQELANLVGMTAQATTLPAGSSATAAYNNGVLSLGIPKGDKGDTGNTGPTGPQGPTGPTGATGNGVSSVTLVSTSGAEKTYRIAFTDGNHFDYVVTDGEVTNASLASALSAFLDTTLTVSGKAADAKAVGEEVASVKSALNTVYGDVEGSYPIQFAYEQGAYLTNGFSSSSIRIRTEISAGTYIFSPSSNIYFSIVYYDTDSAGTAFINMGNILTPSKITVARDAYITIQYRNSTSISPSNANELGISVSVGYPLKEQIISVANRIAENINKADAKDFELIVGRAAYYVGKDKTHSTINDALTAWANDNYPAATIYISNGEYDEVVAIENSKDINLIGESKEGTIIRTTQGQYVDAPILIRHGNATIANMTIIADHTGDADFSYEADSNPTCAYGVHIDGGTVGGKVVIRNCRIISEQSPAFGLGTIPNSVIRIEDCEAYCFTAATTATTTKQYRCLSYGCLLCHMSSSENYPVRGTETLQLVNNKFFAKNTRNVIKLNYGTVLTEHMNVLAINNVLSSGAEANKDLLFVPDSGLVTLDAESQGNSCKTMNYSN